MSMTSQFQQADGLYDPRYEHDACGVGVVARLDNQPTNEVVRLAIDALANLEHRGAAGADPETGDGAGILIQMPDALLRDVVEFELPPAGCYGVAMCFLPKAGEARAELEAMLERIVVAEGQHVLGWRDVPTDDRHIGSTARASQPTIRQLFIGAGPAQAADQDAFERKLYVIRRLAEKEYGERMYIASLLLADAGLQGHADQLPAGQLLPRSRRRAPRVRARARALALLDEHLPELGARAPLPDDRPQRRDQHAPGQRQLDARAREPDGERAVRRGPREGAAGRAPGRLGLGDLRQRARAADARGALAAARGDDDDPRGLPQPRRRAAARARRLLRLPLLLHGAVGRPGGDRLHRRPRDRRDARPQRPAPRPLAGDDRRLRDPRLRGGAAADPGLADQAARAAAARQAVPRRPRAGADRPRRGDQARGRDAQALRRLVRRAHGALRPAAARAGARARAAAARAPARLRLLARGHRRDAADDGDHGRGAGRIDGRRHLAGGALGRRADAVQLLQAALRAGHQPADRPDPRGHRDEHRRRPRRRGQPPHGEPEPRPPAGARPADPAQPRARDAAHGHRATSSSRTRSTSPGRSPTGRTGWRRR